MPNRTFIKDVKEIEHLNELDLIVKNQRNEKRSETKKERRNRHYIKLLIKHQLKSATDEVL